MTAVTAAIRTEDHLTLMFDDGISATVYTSQLRYQEVVNALKRKDYDLVRRIALPAEQVKSNLRDTFGIPGEQVTVEHGVVRYEGKEMDNTLTRRMIQMLEEGFDISPLKLFLINLQKNPSYRAVTELYGFLEKGNLPITEDGHFLAYKKVKGNYTDCRTGTFDNSIGQVCSMPRNEVDEDSRNECSNGLHFCSRNYLSNFGGEHIMIVKINPADVVAIPNDYSGSKGRTCRYEVIGEIGEGKLEGSFRDTRPVTINLNIDIEEDWLSEDEDDDGDDWNDDDDDDDGDVSYATSTGLVVEDDATEVTNSAFVGIPADGEPVVVPRSVAIEIANSLDEEDIWSIVAYHPVLGTEIGRYSTVREAASAQNANVSSIRKVLNGQRLTAGGLVWKREANDEQNTNTALHQHGTIFGGKPHHEV